MLNKKGKERKITRTLKLRNTRNEIMKWRKKLEHKKMKKQTSPPSL
jgi:hypothetical protein